MQRITIVLDDELMEAVDRLAAERGYQNRSEAIRDLARRGIRQAAEETAVEGHCVAALVYAYAYDHRDLAARIAQVFHDAHDLSVSTLQVPLDHDSRAEVTVLRGDAAEVGQVADKVLAERGVRHGRVVMIPVELTHETHAHHGQAGRRHVHVRVRDAG